MLCSSQTSEIDPSVVASRVGGGFRMPIFWQQELQILHRLATQSDKLAHRLMTVALDKYTDDIVDASHKTTAQYFHR